LLQFPELAIAPLAEKDMCAQIKRQKHCHHKQGKHPTQEQTDSDTVFEGVWLILGSLNYNQNKQPDSTPYAQGSDEHGPHHSQ